MFKKPIVIASAAALIGAATLSTQAKAADPIFGALIGGAFGAAIGHAVDGRHGARVGAGIGALAGAVSATHDGYYDRGYHDRGYYDRSDYDRGHYDRGYYAPAYGYAPSYRYAPSYGYYAPAYPAATIVYRSGHRHYRDHDHRGHHRGDRRWH